MTLIEIYYQERPVSEAAELLAVPQGTVKSRTFYGLKTLREALISRGFTFQSPRTRDGQPEVGAFVQPSRRRYIRLSLHSLCRVPLVAHTVAIRSGPAGPP